MSVDLKDRLGNLPISRTGFRPSRACLYASALTVNDRLGRNLIDEKCNNLITGYSFSNDELLIYLDLTYHDR